MSGQVTLRTNEPVNLVNEGRKIDADLLGLQYFKQSTEEVELIAWELVEYEETTIKLQLNFTEPLLVSTDIKKDLVELWVAKALLLPEHEPYIFVPNNEVKQDVLEEDMIIRREAELPVQVSSQGKLRLSSNLSFQLCLLRLRQLEKRWAEQCS